MKYLKFFSESLISKKYGVFYLTPCFPKGHKQEWLTHCKISIFDISNDKSLLEIKNLIKGLNEKYKNVIYLPIDESIHPGCCSTPDSIEYIATELYNGLKSIFNKMFGSSYIKLAWSVIELDDIESIDSLHHVATRTKLPSGNSIASNVDIIKFGREFDKIKEAGIYHI